MEIFLSNTFRLKIGNLKSRCYRRFLATKGEQRELDTELNKMGNISLLASQEATASHSRGPQHCAPPRGLTLLPFPFRYRIVGGLRERFWTLEVCQSNWRMDRIQSPRKLGKLIGHFEKAPGPSQIQDPVYKPRGTKQLSLACLHSYTVHTPVLSMATWP